MSSFDYIIVGAGTAGCVLANRLTENPSIQVLLVEAGMDSRDPRIFTPSSYPLLNGTYMNWNFFTEPQKKLGGARYTNREVRRWGSSAINCMAYIRGNKADFENWESMGCQGWSYAEMLPYFKNQKITWIYTMNFTGKGAH